MALLSKGAMARGVNGLFKAGGVDVGTILFFKKFSEMAKGIVCSSGTAFRMSCGKIVPEATGERFIKLIKYGYRKIDKVYALEPYSKLIIEEMDWPTVAMFLGHVRRGGESLQVLEALNVLIDKIREEGRSPAFKKQLNSFHRSANKNYQGLLNYEKALFECSSRILVLRIDFSYRKEHCKVDQEIALQHRKQLFDNARSNKLFAHMLGYVTKLEYGVEKGFHFHCMFFFDGGKVREDITFAKRIGEYWGAVITEGMGSYYNCNYAKEAYRCCGIGMVSHSDREKRDALRRAMVYLTKTDLYMKLKAKGRALTRGVMPRSPSGRGRPRAVTISL
ncbi:inovirus-type Gp2 protein [Pseudomonas sp. PDNC002]|uniref:YagK/YfjJ domain-containing protein n=1 Tax=Pseudomonas sp. PDNC002 TaxID=2811422 RepID=UPI001962AFAE|nr:inovirus-type Gp2 protein [Pseudomonas sp. PDNC002]QRY76917.1 inovirus-type Gp2 protein [Pseudomonas sp. PDNC002]